MMILAQTARPELSPADIPAWIMLIVGIVSYLTVAAAFADRRK